MTSYITHTHTHKKQLVTISESNLSDFRLSILTVATLLALSFSQTSFGATGDAADGLVTPFATPSERFEGDTTWSNVGGCISGEKTFSSIGITSSNLIGDEDYPVQGLWVAEGSTLTIDDSNNEFPESFIEVKSKEGQVIQVIGVLDAGSSTLNFKQSLTIAVDGENGAEQTYAFFSWGGSEICVDGTLKLTSTGGVEDNISLQFEDDSKLEVQFLDLTVHGQSGTSHGLVAWGGNFTFKEGAFIRVDTTDGEVDYKNAKGIYLNNGQMRTGGIVTFDMNAPGADLTGLHLGEASEMQADQIVLDVSGGSSAGIYVHDNSSLTINSVEGTVVSDQTLGKNQAAQGVYASTKSEIEINSVNLVVKGAAGTESGEHNFGLLVSDNARLIVSESVQIDADTALQAEGSSTIEIKKDFVALLSEESAAASDVDWITTENGSGLVALNEGQISVNSGEQGVVDFCGYTHQSNGGIINLNMTQAGSKWSVTKDSELTNWKLTQGLVDLSGIQKKQENAAHEYRRITTNTFIATENAQVKFRMDLANEKQGDVLVDQLIVSGAAEGSFIADITLDGRELVPEKWYSNNWLVSQGKGSILTITNKEGTNSFTGNGMVTTWALAFVSDDRKELLESEDGRGQLTNSGDGVGNWYLIRTDKEAPVTPPVDPSEMQQLTNLGISTAQAMSFAAELDDLRTRLGEVRYSTQDGVWAKASYTKERADGFNGRGFKQKTTDIHVGLDRLVASDEDATWLVGGAFRYAHSKQEGFAAAQGGDGELDQYSAKLYATYLRDDGAYADFVLQAGRYEQELKGLANDKQSAFSADYDTYGFGASVEVGHMFKFDDGVGDRSWCKQCFIEPQLQLSYFYAKGADYTTSTGMQVSQGNADFLTGRAGVVIGKKFNYGSGDALDKRYVQIGLTGGVKYEFMGDQIIHFTGVDGVTKSRKADDVGGARYYYGIMGDWQLSDNFRAYARVDREEGDAYTKDFDVSVGLKYQF